jgi:hypothetical protein
VLLGGFVKKNYFKQMLGLLVFCTGWVAHLERIS